jgi:hypothetical protein
MRTPILMLVLLGAGLGWTADLVAQVPGEYPHLVFRDGMGLEVPPPAGPFDNSGVFPAVGGSILDLGLTYQAEFGSNENVVWGLLVSVHQTPFPTNQIPPPLLTDVPFTLRLFPDPTLDPDGFAGGIFQLPPGFYDGDVYVQGLIFDVTHDPAVQLSNGINLSFEVPGFNVSYGYTLNAIGTLGDMRDPGVIEIDPELGSQLKPIGDQPAPPPTPTNPGVPLGVFRFLDVLPNLPDAPLNPMVRPMTRMAVDTGDDETELIVEDTSGFPQRGHLIIPKDPSQAASLSPQTRNPWANPVAGGVQPPNVEYIRYTGIDQTTFLNCERILVGTKGVSQVRHLIGDIVMGDFTMVTSAHALKRDRVCLDATNRDTPHVVIPEFTFTPEAASEPVTMDLDLYLFEIASNGSQGFMVFDRESNIWRVLAGTLRTPAIGGWNPMVTVASDGRSLVAALVPADHAPGTGPGGGWVNSDPDQAWAIRLDGEVWPATGESTWQLEYETVDSFPGNQVTLRARKIKMNTTFIFGADPEDYIVFVGLDNKFKRSLTGTNKVAFSDGPGPDADFVSYEWEFIREQVRVRDLFAVPLVPPGSSRMLPNMPRPYLTFDFPPNGFGNTVSRYDQGFAFTRDRASILMSGGTGFPEEPQEDAFLITASGSAANGEPAFTISNLTGHRNVIASAGQHGDVDIRGFLNQGGHGQGGKISLSPDGTRGAWVTAQGSRRDWIQIARLNGLDFGMVLNIYQEPSGAFRESGPYDTDRIVTGLQFAGNDHLVFYMGRNRYDDPINLDFPGQPPAMDLFVYDIVADTMTNLTKSAGGSGFDVLGLMKPGGFWSSDNGNFLYYIRSGQLGPGQSLPEGTEVSNILGVSAQTLELFEVSGDEFGATALIPHIVLPGDEGLAPIESLDGMRFTMGSGVQDGMMFFTAHRAGDGLEADDVFVVNSEAPFVHFPVTDVGTPGVHVTNVTPNPHAAHVAFARTNDANPTAPRQHPFVVDMTSFLFERDIFPTFQSGGNFIGRVMDGSFHFLPPSGNAPTALILVLGFSSLEPFGIAQTAAPGYYPLSAVSDPVTEPIPIVLAITDTISLPNDFRFYVVNALPFLGD